MTRYVEIVVWAVAYVEDGQIYGVEIEVVYFRRIFDEKGDGSRREVFVY